MHELFINIRAVGITDVEYARIQERAAQILNVRGIDSDDLILVIEMIPISTSAQAPGEPPTEPRPKKAGQSRSTAKVLQRPMRNGREQAVFLLCRFLPSNRFDLYFVADRKPANRRFAGFRSANT